jgi:hypothetical protein
MEMEVTNGTCLDAAHRVDTIDVCEAQIFDASLEDNEHVFETDSCDDSSPGTAALDDVSHQNEDSFESAEERSNQQWDALTNSSRTKHDCDEDETTAVDNITASTSRYPNGELAPHLALHDTQVTDNLPDDPFAAPEYETALNSSIDIGAHTCTVSTSFDEENTPPSFSALSGSLSPIAKSSSPHNCDDDISSAQFVVLEKNGAPSSETASNELVDDIVSSSVGTLSGEQIGNGNEAQGTIFDVLSQPVDGVSEAETTQFKCPDVNAEKDQYETNSYLMESIPKSVSSPSTNVDNPDESSAADKSQESDDLISFQDTFDSTSNALLKHLRGAAETRKREVTRCRYSLERKEQIMIDEKKVRASMPTVEETLPVAPLRRSSMPTNPKKKIEGLNPYKPFVARPMPSTNVNTEKSRRSSVSVTDPKSSTMLPARKKLAPHEDPYKPFKARPMPTTSHDAPSIIGTKRKMSAALRPHPEQNKSSVKPAALNAKPPLRLLSGRDASMAKEESLRERIEKENARVRRESTFKARPLPSSSISSGSLIGEKLVVGNDKENDASSRKRLASIQPFTPRSTRRAEERAEFDSERVQRENALKTDGKNRRLSVLDKTKKDIDELKGCIR